MKSVLAREKLEVAALAAVTIVVLLNSMFFASLSVNQSQAWMWISDDALQLGVIYVFFLVFSLLCIAAKKTFWIRRGFMAVLAVMTGHIFLNLYHLIINQSVNHNGQIILLDAFIIWISSLLTFSLWYWLLDRSGPIERALTQELHRHDFHFAQYDLDRTGWKSWQPRFIDYLSLSFFISTNFSAADVVPLSRGAKVLVMIESALSLVIVAMVITRAITLL